MAVVFITGCSSGIGKALAQTFHHQGFQVVATARQLEALRSLQSLGIRTYELDVTDTDQVQQVIQQVIGAEGGIDILVNNAGYGLMGPLMDISPEKIGHQFHTNVFAPLAIAQAVAPSMKPQGQGMIVNIGSISGLVPTPFAGAYCASKSALHAITETLRLELAPFGIQVILVQPGAIQSNFGQAATATQVLPPNSWYGDRADAIANRANLSQVDATPVDEFAAQLVKLLMQRSPPAIIRLGKKSMWLPWLKTILSSRILDQILRKKFGLW